jgi:hypothetical protein
MSESTRPKRVVVGGDRLASSQPTPAAPMLGRMADGQAVEWVTWPEAAAIVGCPVPTIDWYTRTGRIQKRPRHGARPSLSRSSVEEFARWWHHVQTARADRRVTRRTRKPAGPRPGPEARESQPDGLPPPPDSRTWIPTARAAELLDVSPATVARLAKQGNYPALLHAGRWWVDGQAVVASAEDRSRWVSYVEAARLAGCSTGAIGYAVRHGGITQREVTNRALPSLERSSVLGFAEGRAARARALARSRVPDPARDAGPPDDGDVWLDTATTALVLGISRTRVGQLARRGRLPCTEMAGRRWFRRSDVECAAATRVFLRRQREMASVAS